MLKKRSLTTILLVLLAMTIIAQQLEPIDIIPLTEKINFDGKLDEAIWSEKTTIHTIQIQPYSGKKPVEEGEIYLTYDKQFLYLAAKIEGENIKAPSKKRDEFSLISDYIGVFLDGYLDKENALGFLTTPTGTRTDFTVFDDAIGGFPINLDWNTYWDVKTNVTLDQWTVEMRIPFSSLQFQDNNGIVEMGMIIWRFNANKNEFSTFPPIKNDWGVWSSFKPSKAIKIRFRDIKPSKPIYVTPYILASASIKNDDDPPYNTDYNNNFSTGIDAKYSLTSNLTLDLSFNTDFAQVEADDAQVNLDRFSLFFPEKRQFYQERASIFDLRMGGSNRVFYSRKIGIDEEGNLEKVLGGLRLTGRIGDYDIGVINMMTRNVKWSPKNNFSVFRVRKKVLNDNSYVGFLGTSKIDFDGKYNHVYALEGTLRLKYNNLLKLRFAQSFTDEYINNPLSLSPTRFLINIEKTQFNGFTYDLALGRSGRDYNPEMGFETRNNFTAIFAILGYGWTKPEESKILQQEIKMYNFTFIDNETNLDETSNMGISFKTNWKSGHRFSIFSYLRRERLFSDISIVDGFNVKSGLYPINVWSVDFNTPGSKSFQYSINLRAGDIFDSKFFNIRQTVDWVAFPDLTLSAFYNYNPIYKSSWNSKDIIHVHLARLKVLYTLSTKISLSGFLQATSEGEVGVGNVRFRYNPSEGIDWFLVYNNVTNLDLAFNNNQFDRGVSDQVFITKLTYTFRL